MKQETLEEAAENYTIDFATMSAFKLGAKWQAERMYSELQVHQIIELIRITGESPEFIMKQLDKPIHRNNLSL